MGTTDANGIYFYETTDAVSPLQTLLNLGQQSVSDALTTRAKRTNSVAGSPPSSPGVGDEWYQTDTGNLYIHNATGSTWSLIAMPVLTGTFVANGAIWTAGSGVNRLTRTGNRWLLDVSLHSNNTGTFSAGVASLGTVPAVAQISGGGFIATAGRYLPGTSNWLPCAIEVNLATGATSMFVPTATGSIAGGQFRVQFQATWDA